MCVAFCLHACLHHMRACYLKRPEEDVAPPGTIGTVRCKWSYGCWELTLGSLKEQTLSLTTEKSLDPTVPLIIRILYLLVNSLVTGVIFIFKTLYAQDKQWFFYDYINAFSLYLPLLLIFPCPSTFPFTLHFQSSLV